jgi:hypothetical protein
MTLNPFQHAKEARAQQEKVAAELEELQKKADAREPKVNALWNWAMSRRVSNGVGHDFEWDLSNPRHFGSST